MKPPTGIYWPFIILSYASLFTLGLLDNGRGPYFPDFVEDLGLSDTQGGLFFAVPALVSFLGSLMAPRIIERLGTINLLRMGVLSLVLGYLGMSQSYNWHLVLLTASIFGCGMGFLGVGIHVIIQQGSPVHKRRRLFSGLHSVYAFSSLLAPLAATGMIHMEWSWRQGFLALAGAGGLVLLSSFGVNSSETYSHKAKPVKSQYKVGHFIYVGFFVALYVQAELAITSRFVLFVRRELGMSKEVAPQFLTGFFVCLLLGRIVFTVFRFDFLSNRQIVMGSLVMTIFFFVTGLNGNPLWIALCGLSMGPFFANSMDYVADVFGEEASRGIAYAMSLAALTVVAMHFVLGYLSDQVGLRMALFLGPAGLLVSLLLVLLHPCLFKSNTNSIE